MQFGKEYLIPKPFDPRVLLWEAPAVAKAAMETGVARRPIKDLDAYRESLERILGRSREVMQLIVHKAQQHPAPAGLPGGRARDASSARRGRSSTSALRGRSCSAGPT